MEVLGIDIGGSGIKGSIVDTKSGKLLSDKIRFSTPDTSTPKLILKGINDNIIKKLKWNGKIGCGFPGIVKENKIYSSANISKKWVGVNLKKKFFKKFDLECVVCNDADAAGIAEITLNKDLNTKGTVIIITVGTGLGTSIFYDGKLVPNIEFCHL